MLLTTTVRFIDIIYLLAKDSTNLPIPVVAVTTAMVIYGIALIVKRAIGNVTLRQLMMFYMIQTLMFVFNLAYVAIACPLQISVPETLVVGTFLDILINCGIIYLCTKSIRSHYFAIAGPVPQTNRNV